VIVGEFEHGVEQQPWTSIFSFDLDVVNDRLDRATGYDATLPPARTWAFWAKPAALPHATQYILAIGKNNDATDREIITAHSTGVALFLHSAGGSTVNVNGGASSWGTWQHFAGTRTAAGLLRCYLDGVEVGTPGTVATDITTPVFRLGESTLVATPSRMNGRIASGVLLSGVHPDLIPILAANPWYDLRQHPSAVWCMNPGHVGDSIPGVANDWALQDGNTSLTPENMDSSDIVIDAP
jgi:hypothetical protein